MIWIVVELAIIDELSFLHPTIFGVGLVIARLRAVGLADVRGVATEPLIRSKSMSVRLSVLSWGATAGFGVGQA